MSIVRRPSWWWWALIVLPLAPVAGWFLGATPALDRPAPTAPVTAGTPARAPTRDDAAGHIVPGPRTASQPAPSLFEDAGQRPGVVSSWTTYEAALAESRSTGKAILLDFNAAWCPPCRALQREVFEHPEAGRAVCTEVVPVSLVDRRREDGANPAALDALQARFQVGAFPTLVVFSPATGRVLRFEGYAGREHTLRWIAEAAAAVR